mgnify:CR=1 FL=1
MEFPTSVGMNRRGIAYDGMYVRVPHKRGDEPTYDLPVDVELKSSPQAWG